MHIEIFQNAKKHFRKLGLQFFSTMTNLMKPYHRPTSISFASNFQKVPKQSYFVQMK